MLASYIDRCDEQLVAGWAIAVEHPEQRLELDIQYRDTVVGRCVADRFRGDVKDAGYGDGWCGFEFAMPLFVPRGELQHVRVRVRDGGELLCDPRPAAAPPTTHSRFGGLWIDRDDFAARLAEKQHQGEITGPVADVVTRFERDGYVVLEGAVGAACLDRLDEELERMWRQPPEGLLIETWEPDDQVRFIPPDLAHRGGRTKLLDLHAFSAASREAIAAPDVIAFLHAVFEEAPKAFQTLTFYNGSQQAMHKDTAYVKVDTSPMRMAATWLALEDVHAGAGELEYYVGSHHAPDFLFGGANKWMESSPDDHPRFLESLHEDAARYGHPRRSFRAKRGDVLVWHADLAHGGARITLPGQTRKSLVTHFTGASDEPYFRRGARHAMLHTHGCVFVAQHADVQTR